MHRAHAAERSDATKCHLANSSEKQRTRLRCLYAKTKPVRLRKCDCIFSFLFVHDRWLSLFISWETQLWMKLVENGAHKNFRQLLESRWIKDQTVIGVRSVRRWLRRRIHLMCAFIFHLFSIKLIHFNWSIFVCPPAACNAVIDIAA